MEKPGTFVQWWKPTLTSQHGRDKEEDRQQGSDKIISQAWNLTMNIMCGTVSQAFKNSKIQLFYDEIIDLHICRAITKQCYYIQILPIVKYILYDGVDTCISYSVSMRPTNF